VAADPGTSPPRPSWWRPVLTVAVFSALPFAVFLNDNRAEAQLDGPIVAYALVVFAIGLAAVVAANRLRGPFARERAAVVFAVGAYAFFHFEFARDVTEWVGLSRDSAAATLIVWLALFAVAVAVAVRLSRHAAAWTYAVIAGALLFAFPAVEYGDYKLSDSAAAADSRPDVWLIVLDGYASEDVLADTVGYDNSGFLEGLEERGFRVHDDATASYPETFLGIASMLEMDYPAQAGELGDHTPYYAAIEGDNATVREFGELGYEYAAGSDYSSFDCTDHVDLCVEPDAGTIDVLIGERERALLAATPLIEVLPAIGIHPSTLRGYLSLPEWVDEVEDRRSGAPLFAFAHVLAPHPPYRYLPGCELKTDLKDPSLIDWGQSDGAGGEGYATAAECLARPVLDAVDEIIARDPDAIVLVQGDHGPKFDGMNFHRPLSEWTGGELRERFPLLNAQRLPRGCEGGRGAELVVNTFRYVLACITGDPAQPLPERHFMIDLESERIEAVDGELLEP
jgi:hypothetical protein